MDLTILTQNWLLDTFGRRMNNGSLEIWDAPPRLLESPVTEPSQLLVSLPFSSPAFMPAIDGMAEAFPLPASVIRANGIANWGQLVTEAGDCLAMLTIGLHSDEQDVRLDRLDLQRGGSVSVRVIVTWPRV